MHLNILTQRSLVLFSPFYILMGSRSAKGQYLAAWTIKNSQRYSPDMAINLE